MQRNKCVNTRLFKYFTILILVALSISSAYAQCPVTAGFTWSPNCMEVTFNSTSSSGTGEIDGFEWDFGDTYNSTDENPIHTYAAPGSYNVTLIVTDTSGCGDTTIVNITLQPYPVAAYTFSPDSACPGTLVGFDAASSTGATSFQWDFGDGNTGSSSSIQHAYDETYTTAACNLYATYTAILTVTNADGCTDTYNDTISVGTLPLPRITDSDPFAPFSNCDNASASNPDYELTVNNATPNWGCVAYIDIDWGDGFLTTGLTSASFSVSHTYTSLGVYDLVVTAVSDNGCSNDTTYFVINESIPAGSFGSSGSYSGCAPVTYYFPVSNIDTNSVGTSYTFYWGDGTSDTMTQGWADTATFIPHTYYQSACRTNNNQNYVARMHVENHCDSLNVIQDGNELPRGRAIEVSSGRN